MTIPIPDRSTDNTLVDDGTDVRNNYFNETVFPLHNVGKPTIDGDDDNKGILTGIAPFEDGWDYAKAIESGDWMGGISGAVAVGLDVESAVTDPIGFVAGMLFTWMLEHVEPLRQALDSLAGNPDMVKAYATSWENISKEMTTLHDDLESSVSESTSEWKGAAADAYRNRSATVGKAVASSAGAAHGISKLTEAMSEIVGGVRTVVRDILASLAGELVSWAIEEASTVGFGTPVVIAQAMSAIARDAAAVARLMTKLEHSLAGAYKELGNLKTVFDSLTKAFEALTGD